MHYADFDTFTVDEALLEDHGFKQTDGVLTVATGDDATYCVESTYTVSPTPPTTWLKLAAECKSRTLPVT